MPGDHQNCRIPGAAGDYCCQRHTSLKIKAKKASTNFVDAFLFLSMKLRRLVEPVSRPASAAAAAYPAFEPVLGDVAYTAAQQAGCFFGFLFAQKQQIDNLLLFGSQPF